MIISEDYMTRTDGVKLIRRYSDRHMMLRQIDTGAEYAEAIDVENSPHTYEETSTPITDGEFLDAQDALDMILGEEVTDDGQTDGE